MNTAKVHAPDTRLYVNAGMLFPACAANAPLLDIDKGRWTVGKSVDVTCKRCGVIVRNRARALGIDK